VPSRVAGTSALSFMAPFSVTPCATKHGGAFKFLAVTGTDSLFSVSVSEVHLHQSHSWAQSVFETSSNINARGLPARVVVVQRVRIAVPSSTAPPSVTASGTEEDGTL